MKKTILISIVASSVLFGATVTDLSTDQVNLGTGSDISNAIVNQGTIDITDGTGTTSVNNYTHGGHNGEGANENTIEGTTVNGDSTENSSITIDQGRLNATNGATVTDSEDHSENTIEGGTIDAGSTSSVTVKQADISIDSAIYNNMEVHSTNTIDTVDIDASGGSNTEVTQATLVINSDGNLTGVDADYAKITLTNEITNGTILNSTVKQAHTEINAKVTGLAITQTNTIEDLNTDNSDINGSKILQGVTKIDGDGTTVANLSTTAINNMNALDAVGSNVVQNNINIQSGSIVNGMTSTTTVNHNTINSVDATDSEISQNTFSMANGSSVTSLVTEHNNIISNSDFTEAHVGQDIIDLDNSTLSNGVVIKSINKIDNVTADGAKNTLYQGVTVVKGSTLNATTSIESNNNIEFVNLNDGNITQNYVSLVNNGTMGTLKLDNMNIVSGVDVSGSDMNNSSISQAEFTMIGSTLNGELTQNTRNELEHVTVSDSTIAQAKVAIGNSTVENINIGTSSSDVTNDIDSPSISESTVSQNGLKICNATVTTLSVVQDNDLSGGDITGSNVVQGDINIEGSGDDCVFAQAEHTHAY